MNVFFADGWRISQVILVFNHLFMSLLSHSSNTHDVAHALLCFVWSTWLV
jgi:hypothetical protein